MWADTEGTQIMTERARSNISSTQPEGWEQRWERTRADFHHHRVGAAQYKSSLSLFCSVLLLLEHVQAWGQRVALLPGCEWGWRELLKVNITVCILISCSYTHQNQEAPRGRELLETMLRDSQGCRLCSGPSAPGVCSSILGCGFAAASWS